MEKEKSRKLLVFGLMGVLAISLVAAAGYYALVTVNLDIQQPIEVEGNLEQSKSCNAGQVCLGSAVRISNDANSIKTVTVTNDNTDEEIEVGYVGKLTLVNKDLDDWEQHPEIATADIYYTVLGDSFTWRYKSKSGFDSEDYTLIYYKDNDANADDTERLVTLGSGDDSITTKLPQSNDWNEGADANYCGLANGYDDYNHCKGAKLWLIPDAAIDGNNVDWSYASQFMFETDLVWSSNSDTRLRIPANSYVEFYPQFNVSDYAAGGESSIAITVA